MGNKQPKKAKANLSTNRILSASVSCYTKEIIFSDENHLARKNHVLPFINPT